MRRQEDLQVKLRERQRRLLVADFDSHPSVLRVVRNFLRDDPLLKSLLEEAARVEPDLDVDGWIDSFQGGGWRRGVDWPHQTEGGQATLIWRLINNLADRDEDARLGVGFMGERNIHDGVRRFTEVVLSPLFDYLVERVGNQSSVLHSLERYVRQVEWFDRDKLVAEYDVDTRNGEDIFDRHLRGFLFREGIDMPFSQARSPSGDSDVLAELDTEDPLVCELKVFDAASRGKKHVATGLHQAHQYAEDYGKTEAYLVIANVSGRPLELAADGQDKAWPRYLDLGGVRIYLIPVRARRLASASKLGPAKPVVFTRDDMINPDVDD